MNKYYVKIKEGDLVNIQIISVGKLKEKYLKDGVNEYLKRLSRYCKMEIIEIDDCHAPDNISDKDIEKIKDIEGEKILAKISLKQYVIALDLKGKEKTSEQLASSLNNLGTYGNSKVTFIVGGSFGLSKNALGRANESLSFSKMTFPHQLFRLILVEQIYRVFKIINNEPYHK